MNINFEFPESELFRIKDILNSNLNSSNDTELNDKLNKIAKSAFTEYVSMISESGFSSKVTEIMQDRIMYLIEHYFQKFPDETEVAKLFNIPTTKSRSLLNNLRSTQRNKLSSKLKEEFKSFLRSGTYVNEKWEFIVKSKPIIQGLNEIIALERPGLSSFTQKQGSAGKVTIPVDSYNFLKDKFRFNYG